MGRAIASRDQDNVERAGDDAKTDADFHVAIAASAHNTLFSHLISSCYRLLWSTQKISRGKIFKKEGNRERIAEQHLKIFEAVRDRDGPGAGEAMRKHIEFVESELRQVLLKGRPRSG